MTTIFTLLFFTCFICLIIGIIKPTIVIKWGDLEKRNRKNVLKYYGIGLIVTFILIGVFTLKTAKTADKSTTAQTESTVKEKTQEEKVTEEAKKKADEEAKEEAEANKTVDSVVSEIAKNKFSDRFISVTFEDDEKTKLTLTVKLANSLTNNSTKTGMLKDVNDIIKELSKNEKFKTLKQFRIVHEGELVDKFGATSKQNAEVITLSMDTINKIQWDNFAYKNFPSIATSFYIHPSFNK